jgi:hypothetical protein
LLLLGAIVNVAVAWGCAVLLKPDLESWKGGETFDPINQKYWLAFISQHHGVTVIVSEWADEPLGVASPVSHELPAWASNLARRMSTDCIILAVGWPTETVWARNVPNPIAPMTFGGAIGLRIAPWDYRLVQFPRVLPYRPIWPGFAINTVFYAFIWWMLFAASFALRRCFRRRRIKRGLCPKCAYPVGTSEKCTECGAAVEAPLAR